MKRAFLAGVLTLSLGSRALAANDRSIGDLRDAGSAAPSAAAVFDGGLPRSADAPPVRAGSRRAPFQLAPKETPAAPAPAPDLGPFPARNVSDGFLGLYPESDFELGTGRCAACRAPREGKWYFPDDVIATPKAGTPALIWLGASQLIEGATLSPDGRSVRLKDGTVLPFELVPKLASNKSYANASTLAFFKGRTIRIRGEYALRDGVRTLVARTLWPEDFRIDPDTLVSTSVAGSRGVDALVSADKGGAKDPFMTRLLWERPGAGREWAGKAVMGFMLNGAQGDDYEAQGGHFSLFTGRFPAGGSMADWTFNNFYDMDLVSEKGINAALVPMDKYMSDLNSGQSWYRPTDMILMVMNDDRVPVEVQEEFKQRYAAYYAHEITYDRTHNTCTALIADPVRAEGWEFPKDGPMNPVSARALSLLAGSFKPAKAKAAAAEAYAKLREEPTRLYPRAAFDSAGGDLLNLESAKGPGRELTPFEEMIQSDLVAVVFVRLPQIPSSRRFGRDPVGSASEFLGRLLTPPRPWETTPSPARPFPPR